MRRLLARGNLSRGQRQLSAARSKRDFSLSAEYSRNAAAASWVNNMNDFDIGAQVRSRAACAH